VEREKAASRQEKISKQVKDLTDLVNSQIKEREETASRQEKISRQVKELTGLVNRKIKENAPNEVKLNSENSKNKTGINGSANMTSGHEDAEGPANQAGTYVLSQNYKNSGPLTKETILNLIKSGHVDRTYFVKTDDNDWQPITNIAYFKTEIENTGKTGHGS
jgi:hypothetical protein